MSEVRSQRSEVRGQKLEVRGRRSEVSGRNYSVRFWIASFNEMIGAPVTIGAPV